MRKLLSRIGTPVVDALGGREFANVIVVTGARDSTMQIDLDVDGEWSGTRSAHHARFARQRNV